MSQLGGVAAMLLCAVLLAPSATSTQGPPEQAPASGSSESSLSLFLLGHRIGEERTTIARTGETAELTSHFEYLDRGTTVALDTTLTYKAADFTPISFNSKGKSYRYFSVDASVPKASGAPASFTLDGMAPIAAQGLLVRYWLAQDRPARITLQPSGDRISVREKKPASVFSDALGPLREFTIDGVTWGRQRLWLTESDLRVVAAVTTAGVLGFEALDPKLEPAIGELIRTAVKARLDEAAIESRSVLPVQPRAFALVGGRLIDGRSDTPLEKSVVIVSNGRILARGPVDSITIPPNIAWIEIGGQTILPGLWDMHAHAGIAEWGPVYLASGVTTIRDMGGEIDVAPALRTAWNSGAALGPRMLLAGLIDGPGPGSFGSVTAANEQEGRDAVTRYKTAGFHQIKLYSLLNRPTATVISAAAHSAGMTVTGHIPDGLSLRDALDLGMDHLAHLAVRGAPGSDELREAIALLKTRGTVIDPTVSWSEMLGRSAETPLVSLQPGLALVDPALRRLLESASGSGTPQEARERLARSLQVIKALQTAGVPIVAGTDKGVPGFSIAREIELYVQAGLTPMEAIRAASTVPARVMGLGNESGVIAPGMRADLLVVEGNPLTRIADIRNVRLVSAGGRLYDPASLRRAGGFR